MTTYEDELRQHREHLGHRHEKLMKNLGYSAKESYKAGNNLERKLHRNSEMKEHEHPYWEGKK